MVSVVIPCFNSAHTLARQLECLARQAHSAPPFEVVVVDNRSTDDLASVVRDSRTRYALDVRLVEASAVAGTAYARNVGVRHARGEALLFCDADDLVGSRFVEFGARSLEDVSLFSGAALPMKADEFPRSVDEAWARLDEPAEWTPPTIGPQRLGIPVLMGAAFGVRKATYVALGGFDQSLGISGEDNDFGLRAVASGVPIAQSECVKVAYRVSSDEIRMIKVGRESRARALLVRRYGLDPETVFPGWRFAPLRVTAAAVKAKVLRSGPEVDRAVRERWIAASRFAVAMARYSHVRRRPASQIGMGLRVGE